MNFIQSIPLFLVSILMLGGCAERQPVDIAIHHVNVIDVASGEVLGDRTVTITGGVIDGVMEADETIESADIIDGTGQYLIPGLWDMHVHFRGGQELVEENRALLDLYIANGITTVRDAGGDITPALLDWREQIENGERIGPHIYTPGPKLDGPDAQWAGSIELDNNAEVTEALDSLQALGADYVKIYDSTISPQVYLTIIREAESRGMVVTGHMPFSMNFRAAVRAGLDATEHLYYPYKSGSEIAGRLTGQYIERMDSDDPIGFYGLLEQVRETYHPDTARVTFGLMAEHGTAAVPTLHIGDLLAHLDEEDHYGDEYLERIGPGIRETYQGRLQGALRRGEEATRFARALQEDFMDMIVPMHEAGVTILAGSDAGPYNSFVYPGPSLHSELEKMVEAGLSPLEALRSATLNGARFMQAEDSLGRIESGYPADLVLLDGNPLEDITRTRQINRVFMGGRMWDRPQLDSLLNNSPSTE